LHRADATGAPLVAVSDPPNFLAITLGFFNHDCGQWYQSLQ
jgi:hypothetical protein